MQQKDLAWQVCCFKSLLPSQSFWWFIDLYYKGGWKSAMHELCHLCSQAARPSLPNPETPRTNTTGCFQRILRCNSVQGNKCTCSHHIIYTKCPYQSWSFLLLLWREKTSQSTSLLNRRQLWNVTVSKWKMFHSNTMYIRHTHIHIVVTPRKPYIHDIGLKQYPIWFLSIYQQVNSMAQ